MSSKLDDKGVRSNTLIDITSNMLTDMTSRLFDKGLLEQADRRIIQQADRHGQTGWLTCTHVEQADRHDKQADRQGVDRTGWSTHHPAGWSTWSNGLIDVHTCRTGWSTWLNLHLTTVSGVRRARSDERVASATCKIRISPQFWASDEHEVTRGLRPQRANFAFHHVGRPTSTKCMTRRLRPQAQEFPFH